MQLSLKRVRAAFVLLGALLLIALMLLVERALDRLANQRALRHRVVAERIFDELERELSAYLALESARPSAAYDAPTSQVDSWAPFVVGYFKVSEGYHVVSGDKLPSQRAARLERALSALWPAPSPLQDTQPRDAQSAPEPQVSALESAKKLKAQPKAKQPESSPEVLRRLNRAQEVREQKKTGKQSQDPFGF